VRSGNSFFCVPLPEQGVPWPAVDLLFSEKVGVVDLKARFKFDDGLVHEKELGAESHNGNQFSLLSGFNMGMAQYKAPFDEFKASNKLRAQVSLPWAGDTVIEFDISGASEALSKVPCEER
jgi:hypothetical protein